eukprot:gene3751-4670_t
MAFKLNVSKYRHTSGKVDKKELWYPDINTSGSGAASTFIRSNARYIGLNWQSTTATVGLIPLKQYGKRKDSVFLIHAHGSQLTDFDFNPFDDFSLATSSDDATIKIWNFRESILNSSTTLSSPIAVLNGHQRGVEVIAWHPTAENILASGSADKTVRIWDTQSGTEKFVIDSFDNTVLSICWNYDGSLLATTSKDLKIRIIDPRNGTVTAIGDGPQGVKPSRVIWLGNSPYILTSGFSKMRERQLQVWDSRDLSKPVKTTTLDSSTGIINPVYDQDAQLLFIAGTGDSTIRCFDLTTQFTPEPAFTELSSVVDATPLKGICLIPKRALDVMEVEIDRVLKATPNNIIPVTYTMSRKSKSSFAEDLYPLTSSTKPSLTSEEWLGGENKNPLLVSLDPAIAPKIEDLSVSEPTTNTGTPKSTFFTDDNDSEVNSKSSTSSVAGDTQSPALFKQETIESPSPSSPQLSTSGNSTPTVTKVDDVNRTGIIPKVVRSSKYRHIVGTLCPKVTHYTNLKISGNTSNTTIAVNSEYIAVPWTGTGGPLAVIPISQVGRQINIPCIEVGSQLMDYDLSQFNPSIVATGSEDSHIKIWKVPQGGLPKTGKNYTTAESDLIGHNRKIVSVNFHPTAENVLISTGGDMVVKLWDLNQATEKGSFSGHTDMITSVNVNYTGDQLVTGCKDKMMRIFDPRGNSIIAETVAHTGAKGFKGVWCGQTSNIFTVGFTKSSEREYSLWDSRNLSNGPLNSGIIDHLAGVITPYYDEDTSVVYLAGKGDGTILMYEINDSEPYTHYLTKYTSGTPQMGIAPVSKHTLNVKGCEIAKFYKVSDTTVEPITMTVPRTRMEYFQDDVFVPTRSTQPTMTADEWFDGTTRSPELVSLCPQGMSPLSTAPPPPKKEREIIAQTVVDDSPSRDQVMDGFFGRIKQKTYDEEDTGKRYSTPTFGDDVVSDSEWD